MTATTVGALDETLLRDLYATPPPEFVATRNDLVKGLRREKRRDDATALAALRRPGWDDWALNAVAASDAAVVAGFASAAAEVREAQSAAIEGRDGPDIRAALKDLRERSAELVRLAEAALGGAGRQPTAGEINTRLSQVATNDVAVEQLLVGILGSGDTAPKDLFGGLAPADRPTRPVPTKAAAKKSAPARPSPTAAPAPDEPRRDAAAERAARAERTRRKDALAAASREHSAAVKARHRADAEVDKAESAVDKARAVLAAAEDALAAARAERDAKQAEVDTAGAVADDARAALAALDT